MADTTLIGRLIPKVNAIRSRLYEKTGVREFRVFRVIRTWSGGEVGRGIATLEELEIDPSPDVVFDNGRQDRLERGRVEDGFCKLLEVSLELIESDLTGQPLARGQECYYRITERNEHAASPSYWVLEGTPWADRDNFQWIVRLRRYEVAES
jgi:hypothetical protein